MLIPLKLMFDRVELARQDGDTTFFMHLMYLGEMLTKLVTSAFVSSIGDDRERHRYNLIHSIIRADGLGEWVRCLDETLTGTASQYLLAPMKDERRQLTQRVNEEAWQFECVQHLHSALDLVSDDVEDLQTRLALRQWFSYFVQLRNKTRGHGATTPRLCSELAVHLERSIWIIVDNFTLCQRPWAYLHRNLSGKFRVVPLGGDEKQFDPLKTSLASQTTQYRGLVDGIYVMLGEPVRNELMWTDVDIADFMFPNGGFNGKGFELLSSITDNRRNADASSYLAPPGERPASETEGKGVLDVVGQSWSNVPSVAAGYVKRPLLEAALSSVLRNDRHPVITLVGRGGIGKTSLALEVVNTLAHQGMFEAIFWFSARDIDLLERGPKIVNPHVLSQADIAREFVRLLQPGEESQPGFKPLDYFATALGGSPMGGAALYVFDNFETVQNPGDLFAWLDNFIRLPNKILITTRQRDFKADYPIEVRGMNDVESEQLIAATASRLGISALLSPKYVQEVLEEADGHPYIMKILLGEVAKAGRLVKVERIVASNEEILDALFERTYSNLQPVSKRVFLTLCSWRSLVPEVALEAVLLRPSNEKMDVASAIDELVSSSFVDRRVAADGTEFLDVALAAHVFGRRKLQISPMKAAVEADIDFLQQIGATSVSGLRHGLRPRIEKLFQSIATRVSQGRSDLDQFLPSLHFICRQYPPAWMMLGKLLEELGGANAAEKTCECYQNFLETPQTVADQRLAWDSLARLYRENRNWTAAAQAMINSCKLVDSDFSILSSAANWLNNLLRENYLAVDSDEKRLLYRELVQLMERRIGEADPTDLSRMAWLYIHLKDLRKARETAEKGVSIDASNEHCLRIIERLRSESF